MLEPVKPRTISTSRWKLGLYLGLGLVFVTVGLVVGDSSKPRAFEVELFTILSALCCGLFAWLLVFPGRVLLHAEGFTVKGGFQLIPWTVRWGDVDAFVPLDYSRLGTSAFDTRAAIATLPGGASRDFVAQTKFCRSGGDPPKASRTT